MVQLKMHRTSRTVLTPLTMQDVFIFVRLSPMQVNAVGWFLVCCDEMNMWTMTVVDCEVNGPPSQDILNFIILYPESWSKI